jgi:hypothetical protein
MREIQEFVAHINETIPAVVSRFNFEKQQYIVGRSNTDDSSLGEFIDPDIHDGTIVSSNGYARLARHKPTNTICLITSKASMNLQGVMQDDGAILATREGLEASYITAAYRTRSDEDMYMVVPKIRRALRKFNEDLGERSEKHFTLYGTSFEKPFKKSMLSKLFNKKAPPIDADQVEVYTNGRVAYALAYDGHGYRVRFIAPTRRKGGSFVPVNLGQNALTRRFGSVSKTIARKDTYAEAHNELKKHWQTLSSKLWDEKGIYEGEGRLFRTRKFGHDIVNHIIDNGLQIGVVTLIVGVLTGLINPKYGIISGIIAAVIHTSMDLAVDEGYEASRHAIDKTKEAKKKLNIEAYDFNEDVSDHFKVQTRENIVKLAAKMDLSRFRASDFEFLNTNDSRMLTDHEKKVDGFRPSSLRAHLLHVHQRGFSSSCYLPDKATRVDKFQSGLVRLMNEKKDGTIVIYAKYRADLCRVESLRLPWDKRDRLRDKVWRYEYNRKNENFHHGFKRGKPVSIDEMIEDLEGNLMFKHGTVPEENRATAIAAIRESFDNVSNDDDRQSTLYMGGMPARPPKALVLS